MAEAPFDVPRAHRWFAVELNNLSWDLVEADARTPEEIERMIHAAHGACFHWLQVGDLLNHLRAQVLLASAYIKAGLGEAALRHAQRALALSVQAGDTQTPFDRATALGCAAYAHAALGEMDIARMQHQQAVEIVPTFKHEDAKATFHKLYPPLA